MEIEPPGYREYNYPQKPGVYIMKDIDNKIIYIGKAKNLNKRIKSYFLRKETHSGEKNWKTSVLVSRISKIEYIITDNEIEAFLLESNLIKKYRPVFNIELKDQQRYTYLKITKEKFPRLIVTRRNRNGDFTGIEGEVFGPFVKGSSRFLTVGLLRKMFKIRICNRLPKKECLEYHIGNCDAPCIDNITQEEYSKNIKSIKNILDVNSNLNDFYKKLEVEMKMASEQREYEKAIHIRDTLFRLKNLLQDQKVEAISNDSIEEYIGIRYDNLKKIVHVMTMISKHGVINDMKKYQFDLIGDNSVENFISQYYYSNHSIPNVIYVNENIKERRKLYLYFKKISNHNVKIVTISSEKQNTNKNKKSGINNENDISKNTNNILQNSKSSIMNLILSNLDTHIQKNYEPALDDLKRSLRLKSIPHIIDCFDISNFGKDFAVGSCTRFMDGIPYKKGYRKFKIKKVITQNDFLMMSEVISRRYSSMTQMERKNTNQELEQFPDLIVIDGGKGHLNVALKTLKQIGLEHIQCISLAKENEEVYLPSSSDPVIIPKNQRSLRILQHIRDESHRFGLTYNRKLREVSMKGHA